MYTNLAGYQSPIQRRRHYLAYQPPATQAVAPNVVAPALQSLMRFGDEVLVKASTVFPFTLFPDTIIVDRSKVTIIKRNFFFVAETYSIRIQDVLNVTTTVGPIFGSISLITRIFNQDDKPHSINFLRRADAIKIKHLVQGYIIAMHHGIDCSEMESSELVPLLNRLGHDQYA